MWSKLMFVMIETSGSQTLVESNRPPSPTSRTAMSTRRQSKCRNPRAVMTSKNVGDRAGSPSASIVRDGRGDLAHPGRDLVRRDRHAIDLDAFGDVGQVRRREQPGPIAGGPQDAGEHRAGRALALGARRRGRSGTRRAGRRAGGEGAASGRASGRPAAAAAARSRCARTRRRGLVVGHRGFTAKARRSR